MKGADKSMVRLFSYGTLQNKAVQLAKLGKELMGQKDSMPDAYELSDDKRISVELKSGLQASVYVQA